MRDCQAFQTSRGFLSFIFAAGLFCSAALAGCGTTKPAQQPADGSKRYHLTGRVVSVESAKQQVVIDAADIPGFMLAMTMGYPVKNPSLLTPLSAEDQITADVVVNGRDMYLENIVVVKKADPAKAPTANEAHPASTLPANQ